MFIGIVVGLVPLLYLYCKHRLVETEPSKRLSIIYIGSIVVLTVVSYCVFTVTTHEYIFTGVFSVLFGWLVTKIIYQSTITSSRIEEEKGILAAIDFERHRCLLIWSIVFIILVIKFCVERPF